MSIITHPGIPSSFHITSIGREQGLTSNQVHNCVQDSQSRFWLSGPTGLSRYDGQTIKNWDERKGLQCTGLRTVYFGQSQIIWIGTDRGLEAFRLDGTPFSLQLPSPWIYGLVECIEEHDNVLNLGTSYGFLSLRLDLGEQRLELLQAYECGFVSSLLRTGRDALYVASGKQGLLLVTPSGNLTHIPYRFSEILCLASNTETSLLVGTDEGAFQFDTHNWQCTPLLPQEHQSQITAIVTCADERWIAASGNLYVQYRNSHEYSEAHAVWSGSRINSIYADELRNIWFSTDSLGLKKISGLRNDIQHIDLGLSGGVYCIKKSSSNRLHIGAEGFSREIKITKSQIEADTQSDQWLPRTTVWDIAEDPNGEHGIWYATQSGLYHVDGQKRCLRVGQHAPVLSGPCRTMLFRGRDLWVGGLAGLCVIRDGEIHEVSCPDGTSFGYVYTMMLSKDGQLWVGTLGKGLWKGQELGFNSVCTAPLQATANCYAVAQNANDVTAIIQDARILLMSATGEVQTLLNLPPIAGWGILWLDVHTLLVGSSDGIRVIHIERPQESRQINLLLSKNAWEFPNNRTLFIREEFLYIGIGAGLFRVALSFVLQHHAAPTANLQHVEWSETQAIKRDKYLHVKPGKWSVVIHCFSPWFIDETQVQFRFKLIGFNQHWSASSRDNTIHFSSLPPGSYALHIQASSPLTGDGEINEALRIHVSAPWWSIGWLNAINWVKERYDKWIASNQRNKALLAQNKMLESEVNDRTRILRSTNESLLQTNKELTQLQLELKETNQNLSALNEQKNHFLGMAAHDLRNPLGVILAYSKFLHLSAEKKLSERENSFILAIERSSQFMLNLVEDLLDISSIESGKVLLKIDRHDLVILVKQHIQLNQVFAEKKDISITLLCPNTPIFCHCDGEKIQQVINNLLSNAIKYSNSHSSVRVDLAVKEESVILSVADEGQGIPVEEQANLFKDFVRTSVKPTAGEKSTGLGLAIVRRIIEGHGGKIWVESTFGEGSCFYVQLPLAQAAEVVKAH
ncbi:ATP-binding protein [Undibacterium sp.]|uniref:sensor histidine kinase n=1 Tax=Undibacterium sp. TaxID=1914977 RepID=UPI003752AC45